MGNLSTEILIIGAGPAGCAAAIALARSGREVLLVDQSEFPREKVCGDALIADSLRALDALGLNHLAGADARRLQTLRIYSPNGAFVPLQGQFACRRRSSFDKALLGAAIDSGARFLAPYRLAGAFVDGGVVKGAQFQRRAASEVLKVSAELTLLATGAAAGPLQVFDVCSRVAPNAMAARAYFRVPEALSQRFDHLSISYHASICPGYGWVFPGADDTFNVGVGVFHDSKRLPGTTNLRLLWEAFITSFSPAAEIVREGVALTKLQGAPLRTNLEGAKLHRPGLLILGEAAGLTFSFSGEGIGKAMESGLLAAELIAKSSEPLAELGPVFEAAMESRYRSLFDGYKTMQNWLSWPVVSNWLTARARSSDYPRRLLEGMLTETIAPEQIFSGAGLLKVLFKRQPTGS